MINILHQMFSSVLQISTNDSMIIEKSWNHCDKWRNCNLKYFSDKDFLWNFRVVHVSSRMSNMTAKKCSEELQKRFLAKDLDMKAVEGLMTEFVT